MACKHGTTAMYCGWCEDQAALSDLAGECKMLREKLSDATAKERERCIAVVMRELDSNGQAEAISLAIREARRLTSRDNRPAESRPGSASC